MQFISEKDINQVIDQLQDQSSNQADFGELLDEQQPHLLAYLLQENFDLLTATEKEYLFYLIQVIYLSVQKHYPEIPVLPENRIGKMEEQIWETFKEVKTRKFNERIDVFFENYAQEDLLAFVEDALVYDHDDDVVSAEGREYLFVILKTAIDALDQTLN